MAHAVVRRLPASVSAYAHSTPDITSASLARLPKASNYMAIQFRDATPGSKIAIAQYFQRMNSSLPTLKGSNGYFLDMSHPFHKSHPSEVPRYASDTLELVAWPFARLRPHTASTTPNPYPERPCKKTKDGQVTMSVTILTPLALHSSGCIRSIIRARTREALKLVVVRGASSSKADNEETGSRSVVEMSDEDADPYKWITPGKLLGSSFSVVGFWLTTGRSLGWTYIVRPKLPIYKTPMSELIDEMRDALAAVKAMADSLEDKWRNPKISPSRTGNSPRLSQLSRRA
ncbi:hypothetical protein FRB96_007870 [Tulasnella sp. 330]|nr:hypothetical protein FRB96_007870 [Tulasnella sp. 330]KAG8873327.1 hypothetical protein FRB97_006833 [Tulasnella sp. 331]KAG8885198.1 hypothetical protein FRB98_001926 [Tulasnella sp. 332]